MKNWTYDPGVRAYAKRDENDKIAAVMEHHNASADDIRSAQADLRAELRDLCARHGTEHVVVGRDVTLTVTVDHSQEIRELGREIDRLDYELRCHAALEHSEFALGDPVVIGPRWTMGPVDGDGGRYVHDNGTGQRGRVLAISPDGDEIRIADETAPYDWAPVSRLVRE